MYLHFLKTKTNQPHSQKTKQKEEKKKKNDDMSFYNMKHSTNLKRDSFDLCNRSSLCLDRVPGVHIHMYLQNCSSPEKKC